MKSGKWNYTQDVHYTALLVCLHKNEETPLHWQNAFDGQTRQIIKVISEDKDPFYLDNQDGTGLLKIQHGGGPDMFSRHLEIGTFEIFQELMEHEWYEYSEEKYLKIESIVDEYQKTNFPEEFERLQRLKVRMQDLVDMKNKFDNQS